VNQAAVAVAKAQIDWVARTSSGTTVMIAAVVGSTQRELNGDAA
tara:strand:- start:2899 stop:3030 length:132 start_codon:yes stop_codon:yes gene_type:complete